MSPLRTPGVSPGVKALLARELEGAKTLKQNKLIFRKCHGRKPVGIYQVTPLLEALRKARPTLCVFAIPGNDDFLTIVPVLAACNNGAD